MTTVRQVLAAKSAAIYAVEPETAVLEAIRAMAEHRVGALLVMRGAELVGVVSERDYARKVILLGRSSSDTPVRTIMSSPVITVSPGEFRVALHAADDRPARAPPAGRRGGQGDRHGVDR